MGSTVKTKYEIKDGKPVLMRLPEIDFIDDKTGKPVGINEFIGKQPIAAFGNSAGDREMLEWTDAGEGPRLKMLVFHDDAKREYAYGPANGLPDSKFGAFPQSLMDEAQEKGWVVIRYAEAKVKFVSACRRRTQDELSPTEKNGSRKKEPQHPWAKQH